MRYRWVVAALLVGALAFVAAGCGGDDDGGSAEGSEDVTGYDLDHGDLEWGRASGLPGRDRRVQRAVSERDREVHVRRRQPRAAAVDSGRGWQSARHRLHRPARPDCRASWSRASCSRSTTSARQIVDNFGESVADVGAFDGTQYAVMFKGLEQVDHLVQRRRLRGGRRRPAGDVGRAQRGSPTRSRPRASPRTRSASTSAGR